MRTTPTTCKAVLTTVFVALSAVILLGGPVMAGLSEISGTVSYRERIALRPGAILEVELLDISLADAPSQRLASIRIKPAGQVPIPFTLGYDPGLIEPNRTYAVSAKLLIDERIIFRSDTVHPVLTRGAGDTVDVMMINTGSRQAVGRPPSGAASTGTSSGEMEALVGPTWVAEDIYGKGVIDTLQSTITFTVDGQVHGSGGCNRFHGSYTRDGNTLTLGQLASTSRACLPAIDEQENRFHAALGETRACRIDDGLLFLIDAQGTPIMRLWRRD